MSATRSSSPKEPATRAVIVSHGQPSNQPAGEDELQTLAKKVAQNLDGWEIFSATLATPEKLERLLESFDSEILIFPMFMTDGWFTQTTLPKRCGNSKVKILPPFGTLPILPQLTRELLKDSARQNGLPTDKLDVLLAAHGSATGEEAAKSTAEFADALSNFHPNINIQIGYLEQEPFLADVASKCLPSTIVLPFFAMHGGHVTIDVPNALNEAGLNGIRLPELGKAKFVPKLIADSIMNESHRD